jgi:hypothetical protein
MKLVVTSVDYAPDDLQSQTPFALELIRQLPGPDRPDYWLGELERPLTWLNENIKEEITHLIVAARWQGTQIGPDIKNLPVGLAYVTDAAQLNAQSVDFAKCKYIAIGTATEVEAGNTPQPPTQVMAGHIAPGFGSGTRS